MKHCKRCDTTKSLDDFNKDKSKADGRCSTCRECSRQRSAAWRDENPERNVEIKRRWYDRNADALLARLRAEYAADPTKKLRTNRESRKRNAERNREKDRERYQLRRERMMTTGKAWRQANYERYLANSRALCARRNARKRGLPSFTVTAKDMRRLLSSPCAVNGCDRTDIEIDHVIPIARGGGHGIGNLASLCRSHNASKCARLWIEFRAYLALKERIAT